MAFLTKSVSTLFETGCRSRLFGIGKAVGIYIKKTSQLIIMPKYCNAKWLKEDVIKTERALVEVYGGRLSDSLEALGY